MQNGMLQYIQTGYNRVGTNGTEINLPNVEPEMIIKPILRYITHGKNIFSGEQQ